MNSFSYYGGRSFSWEGRELRSLTNGSTSASYVYDENGIRTSKTVNGLTTNYFLEGSRIIFQTVGSTRWSFLCYGDELTGFEVEGETYYYLKNLQGDILQIVDEDGEIVVEYLYDDWGKILSVTGELSDTVGEENPFRYRGYYYDSETGLYYVSSRYYDPEVGRFINADTLLAGSAELTGTNLFAYCLNNPVHYADASGRASESCYEDGFDFDSPYVDAYGGGSDAGSNSSSFGSGFFNGFACAPSTPTVCFVAGTLVNGAEGLKPIEEVCVNDYVWAWNEETGKAELKRVTETYINQTNELIHVFVKGEEIICTPEHPFYSPVRGWTAACKLRAGDILVTLSGEYVVLEKIQHELLECPVTVYNLQMADDHSYYVGSAGVLVHNICSSSGSYEIVFQSGKNYIGKGSETRMRVSANLHSTLYDDPVVSMRWDYAPNAEQAFVDEYFKMAVRGVNTSNTYNLIWSPGRSIFINSISR